MPSECAQAVELTRDFLLELASEESATLEPGALRTRAAALLQHFPQSGHQQEGRDSAALTSSGTEQLGISPRPGATAGERLEGAPQGNAFPRARRYPSEAQTVHALVVSCLPEVDMVWVRDDHGRQYSLDRDTEGVRLGDLRQGQAVDCDLAVDGATRPKVVAARVVARVYPDSKGSEE